MRNSAVALAAIAFFALALPVSANGAGGVASAFGPGNSAAGKGLFPGAQPNCVGDIISASRPESAPPDRFNADTRKEILGNIFTAAALIGVAGGGLDCSEFAESQP